MQILENVYSQQAPYTHTNRNGAVNSYMVLKYHVNVKVVEKSCRKYQYISSHKFKKILTEIEIKITRIE